MKPGYGIEHEKPFLEGKPCAKLTRAELSLYLTKLPSPIVENGILIGSVGRMDELKNYGLLITAFANIAADFPDMHVALLGDGPEQQNLRVRAQELGVAQRVFFLGRHPDPENFLAGLDIFALPSKTEGMSNALIEAMASGLPVVCADLPCHHEVFHAGREGVVVSPCTAVTLAASLAELSCKRIIRRAFGAAAREKVLACFTIARMISEYDRLYVDCWQGAAVANCASQDYYSSLKKRSSICHAASSRF